MSDALAALSAADREKLRRAPQPRSVEPMKATLTDRRFSDSGWIFERKLDGVRCTAFREGGRVRLVSRTGLDLSYPTVVESLEAEPGGDFVLDGEVVAFRGGRTSFELLQQRGRLAVRIYLYVFDITWLDGWDLTQLPLLARKRVLRRALSFHGALRYTPHRRGNGEEYYREACERGWEGLIAKRADSTYARARSRDWLKFKCGNEQELVIGGYTDPQGSRTGFGALLVGYNEGGELRYAGKVGTGFNQELLDDLAARLRRIEVPEPPFAGDDLPRRAHWVEPKLVAQIGFSEWTRDGKLRHPRFLGLREDKRPREVVRESPAA